LVLKNVRIEKGQAGVYTFLLQKGAQQWDNVPSRAHYQFGKINLAK